MQLVEARIQSEAATDTGKGSDPAPGESRWRGQSEVSPSLPLPQFQLAPSSGVQPEPGNSSRSGLPMDAVPGQPPVDVGAARAAVQRGTARAEQGDFDRAVAEF